jgi:hypothetical protein
MPQHRLNIGTTWAQHGPMAEHVPEPTAQHTPHTRPTKAQHKNIWFCLLHSGAGGCRREAT